MESALNKLEMYKAVESVCSANHHIWNDITGFGSAFSKFVTKVTRLDLLFSEAMSTNELTKAQLLIIEIDQFLNGKIDSFVTNSTAINSQFSNAYIKIRNGSFE